MKKSLAHGLIAGALAAAGLTAASPSLAQPAPCGFYQPGLIAFLAGRERPAPCAYQGPYIVQQGPTYDGPAIIAPQPTWSPSRTVNYVHGDYRRDVVVAAPPVRRTAARSSTRVVNVQSDLPPPKGKRKGKVEIVRAKAEVRIYGPQRMDIRLYRN